MGAREPDASRDPGTRYCTANPSRRARTDRPDIEDPRSGPRRLDFFGHATHNCAPSRATPRPDAAIASALSAPDQQHPKTMAQYIFTMNRVGKIVPPKRVILRDISLSFFPGAKIGVLGLNGSGKSTLLRIMAGIDTEIEGEARPQPGIKIGYLPQEPQLDPTKDVRGNVEEALGHIKAALTRLDEVYAAYADAGRGLRRPGQGAGRPGEPHRGHRRPQSGAHPGGGRGRPAPAALGRGRRHPLRRRAPPRGPVPAAAVQARHAAARRAHQPPGRRVRRLAGALPPRLPRHRGRRHPRPLLPGQRGRLDPGTGPRLRHPLGGQLLLLAGPEGEAPGTGGEAGPGPGAGHEARAGMGARQPQGAPRQEQGAPGPLRRVAVPGIPEAQRDQRDLHPAGPAPGRPGDRGRGPDQGLRRPPALRGTCPSTCPRAASSASSAPTGRARPPCSAC